MRTTLTGAILLGLLLTGALLSGQADATTMPDVARIASPSPTPFVTRTPHVASAEELAAAQVEWERTRHASTYDNGLGANSTCALCKSPRNYRLDPAAGQAA